MPLRPIFLKILVTFQDRCHSYHFSAPAHLSPKYSSLPLHWPNFTLLFSLPCLPCVCLQFLSMVKNFKSLLTKHSFHLLVCPENSVFSMPSQAQLGGRVSFLRRPSRSFETHEFCYLFWFLSSTSFQSLPPFHQSPGHSVSIHTENHNSGKNQCS